MYSDTILRGGECFLLELILINSSKLKIMMTSEDMKQYDLKCENIDYDNTETRRAFWSILDEAKQRTGFDAASDKVFVQLYPSKCGGCEMYITKLSSYEKRKNGRGISLIEGVGKQTVAYSFERFEWLSAVCTLLDKMGYKGESCAYFNTVSINYYLFLSDMGKDEGQRLCERSFIKEFGRTEDLTSARLYIKEYGECLCDLSAVERLAGM